jgi:Fe2+ transport system protein B
MAQSAVAAIRSGCQMLSEGRAQIEGFKKGTEQAISDVKAIYKEVTGIWGWFKGLFGHKKIEPDRETNVVRTVDKQRPGKKELTYEEFQSQSVHSIFEQLKVYFEAQRQLEEHCRELEAQSSTTDKVADNAIDLIEIRWQMKLMATQVREAMVYTPESLGLQDLYSQFLKTYDEILEEQEFARQVKQKKERDAKWRHELLKRHRIDRAVQVCLVLGLILWMWAWLLSLRWLVMTPSGSLSGW